MSKETEYTFLYIFDAHYKGAIETFVGTGNLMYGTFEAASKAMDVWMKTPSNWHIEKMHFVGVITCENMPEEARPDYD